MAKREQVGGRSLIVDIGLPLLLLIHLPAFFGRPAAGEERGR
jgi:hypothetical protein